MLCWLRLLLCSCWLLLCSLRLLGLLLLCLRLLWLLLLRLCLLSLHPLPSVLLLPPAIRPGGHTGMRAGREGGVHPLLSLKTGTGMITGGLLAGAAMLRAGPVKGRSGGVGIEGLGMGGSMSMTGAVAVAPGGGGPGGGGGGGRPGGTGGKACCGMCCCGMHCWGGGMRIRMKSEPNPRSNRKHSHFNQCDASCRPSRPSRRAPWPPACDPWQQPAEPRRPERLLWLSPPGLWPPSGPLQP